MAEGTPIRALPASPSALLATAALLAAAAAPVPAAAAPPPATGTTSYAETLDVALVEVQVWVSDRQGRPVTGLAAADFTVLHDGEAVTVSHFVEVREGVPVAAAAPAPLAVEAATAAPAAGAPPVEPAHLVLYFDQLHLRARDYPPLLDGVARLLDRGAVPAERVIVLRQDRALHLELPLGSSRAQLDAALRRLAAARLAGEMGDVDQLLAALGTAWQESEELSGSASRMQEAMPGGARAAGGSPRAAVGGPGSGSGAGGLAADTCGVFVSRIGGMVEAWVRERNDRTATTLRHLEQAGVVLAGVPGPKSLVYLSDALEVDPAAPLAAAIGAVCPGQSVDFTPPESPGEVLALTRHLNTNQVTVHALQASGLAAAASGTAASRAGIGGARAARLASSFESAHRASQRRGMGVLAGETGGRLVVNRNEVEGELAGIAGEMGSYYSLAYAPPRERAAGEHRIEVALRDGALQVRHRKGYRAKGDDERLREQLEGVLYLGLTSNPLEVRLGAGDLRPQDGRVVLPLHLFVPVERLTFLDGPGGPAAELRLQVLARSAASPRAEWKRLSVRVPRPAEPGGAARLGVELTLDPGTNVVAVALRDEASKLVSLVSTTLQIDG